MTTRNEELANKHPVKYSRDGGDTIKLGDLIRNFADIIELHSDDLNRALDFLDAQFLFGAWGDVMREVREYSFTKDIRGFIVGAFKEGLRRPRREIDAPKTPPIGTDWCWRDKDSEVAHGPYKSREEAIEEARAENDWSRTVMVGHCVYPDPVHTAGEVMDLEYLLEQMEEHAYDNEYPFEDPAFELKSDKEDGQKAQHAAYRKIEESLKAAVRAWAAESFSPSTSWHTSSQEEEVEINPMLEGDDG